jgi:hypothetical protein
VDPKEQQILNGILEAARWAVSADNGQPWKFQWHKSRLLLILDSSRAHSFFDGQQYAPYFGLGSVIENLCVGARHAGYESHVELFPTSGIEREQVVASISFKQSTPKEATLYPAVFERSTNRRPYDSATVLPEIRASLMKCSEEFAHFKIVLVDEDNLKVKLADMTAKAEAVRFDFSRKEVHADFFKCLRFSKSQAQRTGDGLWIRSLEVNWAEALSMQSLSYWPCAAIGARLGVHRAFSHQSILLLRKTPLLALVISDLPHSLPTQKDFITGGQLCQRLWLTATMHHLSCQPMAALSLFFLQHAAFGDQGFPGQSGRKIGQLREQFYNDFNLSANAHLLMVFRIGYAKAPTARSLRRPLTELLEPFDDSPFIAH